MSNYEESVRCGRVKIGENQLVILEAAGNDPPGILEAERGSRPRPRLAVG